MSPEWVVVGLLPLASGQIIQIDKKLHPKRQKEPRKTTEEISGCV
jgi:hypothetical protein